MDELISRKAVLDFTTEWCNRCGKNKQNNGVMCGCCDLADTIDFIEELPTIPQTKNPTKDIYSAIEYWKSVDEDNNMVKWLSELQEYRKAEREKAEHYEWCHDCKEYDQENHCCHRYSSFIRETLQDNINAVLEDIKAEWIIVGKTTFHYECSICGGAGDKWDKYCKHCGSRMKGDTE